MPCEIPDQFTSRDLDTRLPLIDVATFWATVARSGDCWLWQGATNRDGYGLARLAAIHDRLAHRIAYRLTYGLIRTGFVVRHSCDTPGCINPAHLALGTPSNNATDREQRGRGRWSNRRG